MTPVRDHQTSGLASLSGLQRRIDRSQLTGLTTLLVGVSQLPLAFALAENHWALFVMGSGGWLLIGIGINLLQGREAFEIGWTDDDGIEWLVAAAMVGFALLVVAAAGAALAAP